MKLFKVFILLVILGLIGWWFWKQQNPTPLFVETVEAKRGIVQATVSNTRAGTVKACRRAQLSPALGGQIDTLPFEKGTQVEQGDVLLRIWNKDLKASLELAQQSLVASQKQQQASCLQAAEAKRAAQRVETLSSKQLVAKETLDKAQTQAAITAANCEAAKAQVSVSNAQLKAAQVQLLRTTLTAPFAGTIADINGELNEYVTPSPPGILTLPVIDLIEPGCFMVSAPIDEVDAPKIKADLPATITMDAWRGREFAGKVTRVGSYVIDREKQARTVEVELAFTNSEDLKDLLVGYSADVDIILETHDNTLRIPTETLFDENNIYVLKDGLLQKRELTLGLSNWTYTEVLAGLEAGDKIILTPGAEGIKEGVIATDMKSQPND